jgi:hypothetical protein
MVYFQTESKFGSILEGLGLKKVGIFYSHLKYITAIWYILWPFRNIVAPWYISPRFGILCKEKFWQPCTTEDPSEGLAPRANFIRGKIRQLYWHNPIRTIDVSSVVAQEKPLIQGH